MNRPATRPLGPFQVSGTTDRLVAPDGEWRKIHNLYPTATGGLLSIRGPIPYLTDSSGDPPAEGTASPTVPVVYGEMRSIFHALVHDNERELLLVRVDNEIWEFTGWTQGYRVILAEAPSNPLLVQHLPEPTASDFPDQWVRTPNGVIGIPAGGRAFMYDGSICLPLGYDSIPSPPVGHGPKDSASHYPAVIKDGSDTARVGLNDLGYCVDGLYSVTTTGMPSVFGTGRLGTTIQYDLVQSADENEPANAAGALLKGRYRCKIQDIDIFGNLSPLSPPSNDIRFSAQPSAEFTLDTNFTTFAAGPDDPTMRWVPTERVLKQALWNFRPGADGTIGHNLYRSMDLENSGTADYFLVPRDASTNTNAFATIPDNVSTIFPDNIPDAWLFNRPEEPIPVPLFRIGELAFGRLFAANSIGDPGAIWPSMVGRYGTFLPRFKFYPDPEGAAVTGERRVKGGMLAFSENGAYLIVPNESGEGFRSSTLSATTGCVAPSSIRTLRNSGTTIWLARDGFYGWDDANGIQFLFDTHREFVLEFNRANLHRSIAEFDIHSGEYRCWVPHQSSSVPSLCFCYNGNYWSTREDIRPTGVTVTQDSRRLMLCSGLAPVGASNVNGVWALDKGGPPLVGQAWTGWLKSTAFDSFSSVRKVFVFLRETVVSDDDVLTISAEIDYRVGTVAETTVHLSKVLEESTTFGVLPSVWGVDTFATATTRRRRPFWAVGEIEVPSCEVVSFRFTSTARFEILGYSVEDQPRPRQSSDFAR